jgi:hypothetical protein
VFELYESRWKSVEDCLVFVGDEDGDGLRRRGDRGSGDLGVVGGVFNIAFSGEMGLRSSLFRGGLIVFSGGG